MMSGAAADQAMSTRITGWLRRLAWSVVRRVYRTVRVLPFGHLAVALAQAFRHRQERTQARRWSLRAVREDVIFNRRLAADIAAAIQQRDHLPKRRFRTATFHYFCQDTASPVARHAALQPRIVTLHRELDELNGFLDAGAITEAGSSTATDLRVSLARRLCRLLPRLEHAAAAFHPPSGEQAEGSQDKERRHHHAGREQQTGEDPVKPVRKEGHGQVAGPDQRADDG